MNDKGFSSFELTEGDIFVSNTFINSQSDYKTLVTGNLKDPYGFNEWMATSTSEWRFENEDYGFIGGEEVAIVVWDSDSITMSADDSYVLATPSLAGGELSGGVEWLVPTGISAINVQWSFATTDNFGTIDPSFATLSSKVTAVPEPSAYATLFGLTALCAIFVRCKK